MSSKKLEKLMEEMFIEIGKQVNCEGVPLKLDVYKLKQECIGILLDIQRTQPTTNYFVEPS